MGILNFVVSPGIIAQATETPTQGEEWFKSTKFKLQNCDEFMKDEYVGTDIATGIPRTHLKENYSKLLMIIKKYFTYEGRFHMVYQYRFKLILHFTGKKDIDPSFYLFISLRKMVDKVQTRPKNNDTIVFNHGLIKLLLLEALGKINRDWSSFLFLNGYEVDVVTPKKPKDTHSIQNEQPINEIEVENQKSEPRNVEGEPMVRKMKNEVESGNESETIMLLK